MNHADALEVLAVAAAFDRRTVGEADGLAWSSALPAVEMQAAKDAVIRHYSRSSEWVMPAHIIAIIAEINKARSRELPPVTPPRDLADEPLREIEWKRIWGDAVIAGHTETKAREIANMRISVSDDPLLAIGSAEVEKQLGSFREAFLTPSRPIKPPIVRLPARWAADRGLQILDPDGWRDAGKDFRAPCTEAEFDELLPTCTVGPFERTTETVQMPPIGTTPRDPADVIAEAIEAQRDHFMYRTQTAADHPTARAYDDAARVARQFIAPSIRYLAEDDCGICSGHKDGPHADHHYQQRLPQTEWARPTPEQRELMRLAAEQAERERTAAPTTEEDE